MSELAEFLLARIAEDEERAQHVVVTQRLGEYWPFYWEGKAHFPYGAVEMTEDAWREHILANFPSETVVEDERLLAECEAKRQVLKLAKAVHVDMEHLVPDPSWVVVLEKFVSSLALPYADHPDYREEWKP